MGCVTVVIPTKNEGRTIAECIQSSKGLGPIVVVDSKSTDETVNIARDNNAEVLFFTWNGRFPKKRNWVLQTYDFKTEWALFLDADEIVTPDFVREVEGTLADTPHSAFQVTYASFFMGKQLRWGDQMKKVSLFRVSCGRYEQVCDVNWTELDMEVHEHPVISGTTGKLKSRILHKDYRGLHHYIRKHNDYSTWECNRYQELAKTSTLAVRRSFGHRQLYKYKNLKSWWLAPSYFIAGYILKMGFLDGANGLHFSIMKAIYFYQIRLKLLESAPHTRLQLPRSLRSRLLLEQVS